MGLRFLLQGDCELAKNALPVVGMDVFQPESWILCELRGVVPENLLDIVTHVCGSVVAVSLAALKNRRRGGKQVVETTIG